LQFESVNAIITLSEIFVPLLVLWIRTQWIWESDYLLRCWTPALLCTVGILMYEMRYPPATKRVFYPNIYGILDTSYFDIINFLKALQ